MESIWKYMKVYEKRKEKWAKKKLQRYKNIFVNAEDEPNVQYSWIDGHYSTWLLYFM